MRESKVEDYLVGQVAEFGGKTRKIRYIGRRSCPDRLVLFPRTETAIFVELKRPTKGLTFLQDRERTLLQSCGLITMRINTLDQVDDLIRKYA